MIWECEECKEFTNVYMGDDDNMYCDACWKWYDLQNTRCFSFAAVYDSETGKLLTTDASDIGVGCAERMAMWKLKDEDISTSKIIVVARIRRNRNNKKMSFGNSKPCKQCIQAMSFYGIQRVCYSAGTEFKWEDVSSIMNDYTSCSRVIVSM